MDNLTKEKFGSEMLYRFPEASKLFNNWLEQYKQSIEWTSLFKDHITFYDLPFEQQASIIARFYHECSNGYITQLGKDKYQNQRDYFLVDLFNCFQYINESLITNQQ